MKLMKIGKLEYWLSRSGIWIRERLEASRGHRKGQGSRRTVWERVKVICHYQCPHPAADMRRIRGHWCSIGSYRRNELTNARFVSVFASPRTVAESRRSFAISSIVHHLNFQLLPDDLTCSRNCRTLLLSPTKSVLYSVIGGELRVPIAKQVLIYNPSTMSDGSPSKISQWIGERLHEELRRPPSSCA